jgi:hypothetical protein
MYRGSRLAASFLLLLTGSAVTALGLGVVPRAIGPGGAWIVVPVVVVFGFAHFIALAGLARGRQWARDLAVTIAEAGGGLAIASLVAVLLGADPFAASSPLPEAAARANAAGLLVWTIAMYTLIGVSAGRIGLPGQRGNARWTSTRPASTGAA